MWHYFPRGPLENRVLKTRFKAYICLNSTSQENRARRRKKKKNAEEDRDLGSRDLDHENRVSKTRFTVQNRVS